MDFIIEDALKAHMKQTGKQTIVVELVTAETSDIEISELHVYLADEKKATFLKEKKRYRRYETEGGAVLLPAFPLQCEQTIHFWLRKFWCFKFVGYSGMKI